MFYYSESTKGFYHSLVHKNIPSDCVEISREYYYLLLKEQGNDKQIAPDGTGKPILVNIDNRAYEERDWRNKELLRADHELNKVQDGVGIGSVTSWRDYRCKLRNWPQDEKFPDSNYRPIAPDKGV